MNVSQTLSSAMLSAGDALFNSGTLVAYSGVMPATPETALSGNVALATWTFSATAFSAPTFGAGNESGTASFVASSQTPSSNATVTFMRALQSNGTTVLADYTVGTTGTDVIVGNTGFQTGVPVTLSSFIQRLPAV